MTPNVLDPWHFVIWMTGAAIWTVVSLAVLSLLAAATWQAIAATASVARQLWRIRRGGAPRNADCTVAEAWWFSFWHEGIMR
jgi:hypothetical protein